jgi:hypothetical protein
MSENMKIYNIFVRALETGGKADIYEKVIPEKQMLDLETIDPSYQ